MNGSDNIESVEFKKESGDLGRNQLSRIDQTFEIEDKNSHSIKNRNYFLCTVMLAEDFLTIKFYR